MTILLILFGILLLIAAIGYFCFRTAMVRYQGFSARNYQKGRDKINKRVMSAFIDQMQEGTAWFKSHLSDAEEITLTSYDGLQLKATFLPNPGSDKTIILMHGYRSSAAFDYSVAFRWFYEMGFNLLVAYQRSHGKSEGRYICYGAKERFDCQGWANYIADRFGPEHRIVLDGISMGASTVLMASGLDLPPNVTCVMADSGFTSAWDEIGHVIRHDYHLPAFPFQHLINLYAKLFAKMDLRDASTIKAMETNRLPILLLHGEADFFVPCEMTRRTYEACRTDKCMLTVPGADHGMSLLIDPEGVIRLTDEFLAKYCP